MLKPGGRLSIFEPINSFTFPEPRDSFWGYNATPVLEIAHRVRPLYDRLQPLDSDPMFEFDERALLALAEEVGFSEIHLELQIEIKAATQGSDWEAFLRAAPNPKLPTFEEAIEQVLSPGEAEKLTAHLRPLVETGQKEKRSAVAYLWAVKRQQKHIPSHRRNA